MVSKERAEIGPIILLRFIDLGLLKDLMHITWTGTINLM